jgi:hypothetical protein
MADGNEKYLALPESHNGSLQSLRGVKGTESELEVRRHAHVEQNVTADE